MRALSRNRSGGRALVPLGLALALLAGGLAIAHACFVAVRTSWGWDEVMHAELPAVRLLLHAQRGEADGFFAALHSCEQYPFVWPLALAGFQGILGPGEASARAFGWVVYAFLLWCAALLARRVERAPGAPKAGSRAGWLTLALAAASPLLVAFAPTLFLENASALAIALALLAWLSAWEAAPGARLHPRALLAGAALAIAFFTKFSYGLLLCAALLADLGLRLLPRAERARNARVGASILLVPAIAALWWFVLPLPSGSATAASHRHAFASWIAGNLDLPSAPWSTRLMHFVGFLCGSPLLCALVLAGLLASASRLRSPAVRTLWIALGATLLPPLLHPFHLDRFLIPAAPALFALAGLGWGALLRSRRSLHAAVIVGAPLLLAWCSAPTQSLWLAQRLGLVPADPGARAYFASVLEGWSSPKLARRKVATAGLLRGEAERIVGALAERLGPEERFGWCGGAAEFPPTALHLALLQRGGSAERFLEQAHHRLVFANAPSDPGYAYEELASWAAGFDAIVTSEPPDLKGRASQDYQRTYQRMLVERAGWKLEAVLELEIERPPRAPHLLGLSLARRP